MEFIIVFTAHLLIIVLIAFPAGMLPMVCVLLLSSVMFKTVNFAPSPQFVLPVMLIILQPRWEPAPHNATLPTVQLAPALLNAAPVPPPSS